MASTSHRRNATGILMVEAIMAKIAGEGSFGKPYTSW
jgi:hypothetical protein